jgi:hypothetical protein
MSSHEANIAEEPTGRAYAWIGVAVTVLAFAVALKVPMFSADSWSYLELSNTVFGDFYRYNTLRQFENDNPYSSSFPPLWPVAIALIRRIADVGIYAGCILNFFVCLGLLAALIRLGRRLELPAWTGTATFLGLISCLALIDDVLAARNSAFSLLVLTLAIDLLLRTDLRPAHAAFAGLLMGLGCLNRFDMLPTAVVVGMVVAVRLRRLSAVVSYFAIFVVTLSPWIYYSWIHFHTCLASDNSRQVLMSKNVFVMNYFDPPPARELWSNPKEWLIGLLTNKVPMSWRGLVYCVVYSATPALLGAVLVVWGAGRRPLATTAMRRFAWLGFLLVPFLLLPCTLVGYGDMRYFLPVLLFVIVVLVAALASLIPAAWTARRIRLLILVMAVAVLPKDALRDAVKHRATLFSAGWCTARRAPSHEMQEIGDAVDKDAHGQWNRMMVISVRDDEWDAFEYGALTGRQVSPLPLIITGTLGSLMRDCRITHIYDGGNRIGVMDTGHIKLVPLSVPGLYRVEMPEQHGHGVLPP